MYVCVCVEAAVQCQIGLLHIFIQTAHKISTHMVHKHTRTLTSEEHIFYYSNELFMSVLYGN